MVTKMKSVHRTLVCVKNRSDALFCEGIVHAALFWRHVRARSPRRAPESVCEISISLFTEGSLGLPLIESQSVSQSVCWSDAVHTHRTVREACTHARTHAREGSSSSDHLLSLCCLIDRGGGQPRVEITLHRGEGGGGIGEDLLRTAGDVRGDGVKSGISHTSNGRHASSAFAGDKQSGKRCPLRYLSTCVFCLFLFLLRLPREKGGLLLLLPPHTGVVRATPGGGTERHSSRTIIMRSAAAILAAATALVLLLDGALARHKHRSGNGAQKSDISLWIDQQQTKIFSGLAMEIYAIAEGRVLSPLLDPEFESKLPIIPSEVSHVNFTWKAGAKKYYYNFFRLKSFDESILKTPSITIETQGRVPKRPKEFSILLPCAGKGIAQFGIGLMIESRNGIPLNGTPLRFRLRKECSVREPNPGPCPDGYLGPPHCNKALCYPKCMNGGNCTAPGVCSCPSGYQGPYCEGGICREKCLNGGKCVQKDVCECTKGYFGLHCEFSKCVIPCLNGGKCKGNNICRCQKGFKGNHCEIGRRSPQRSTCTRPCRNGTCQPDNTCLCDPGWFGKLCNKNKPWA